MTSSITAAQPITTPPATIGIFDAGIGGLPLYDLIRRTDPRHRIVYLGDAARRPYGPRPATDVAGFVGEAERFFVDQKCDVWVIACNTASVVAPDSVERTIPVVDMITAIRSAVRHAPEGPVGVLATAGTVASGAVPRVLADREVHQLATEELLRLAEEGIADDRVTPWVEHAFEVLRSGGCTSAVLACTDFTCILEPLRAAAGSCVLIDPLEAAMRLALAAVAAAEFVPEPNGPDLVCLTGPHPVDVVRYASFTYGLDIPAVTYVELT